MIRKVDKYFFFIFREDYGKSPDREELGVQDE
jgi:hypothetical protein